MKIISSNSSGNKEKLFGILCKAENKVPLPLETVISHLKALKTER